jgi:hypothetical protein
LSRCFLSTTSRTRLPAQDEAHPDFVAQTKPTSGSFSMENVEHREILTFGIISGIFTFGIISVGFHEIDVSPSESSREFSPFGIVSFGFLKN